MKQIYRSFLIASFLLFLLSHSIQAQIVPARLVKAPGDTINGFINYYDWAQNPNKIEFKQSVNDDFEIFKAEEIKSFYIPTMKKWYYGKLVHYDYYLKKVNENTGRIARSVSGNFFLNEIFNGKLLSLYMLVDKEQNTRFFIQKDTVLTELINYEYTTFKNGKAYYTKVDQYLTQLKSILGDCDKLNINNGLRYSDKALSHLLSAYHVCKGEQLTLQQSGDKTFFNPILSSGLMYVSQRNSYVPSLGIGLKISLPRQFHNRYAMVQLDQYRYNNTEENSIYKGNTYMATILAGTYLGKSKIQPYVHGGFQFPTKRTITVGAGISYVKKVNLEIRFPSLSGIMATFHYTFGKTMLPIR